MYVLNERYSLKSIDDLDFRKEYKSESKKQKNKFVLICEKRKSILLINKTIFDFLALFVNGNTLTGAIEEYSQKINCTHNDIENQFSSFFHKMCKKDILTEKQEKILHHNKQNIKNGEIVKGYSVIDLIVNKSNTEIYKVKTDKGKIAVFKLVHYNKFDKRSEYIDAVSSLKKEYDLLRKLTAHSNIVNPINYISCNNFECLVLDFVQGINLGIFIRESNFIKSYEEKMLVIKSLLKTMALLHNEDILHGDIHASNFIIFNNIITIIDFGHSQRSLPNEDEVLKKGGVVCYMPPERLNEFDIFKKFKGNSTFFSEVYQIGILLYMLLYEKEPFKGLTYRILTKKIIYEEPYFNTHTPKGEKISNDIIRFVKKAISKNPIERYSSAQEMYNYWKEH
jgi:serine/threonine-protein kinase